MTRFTYIRSRTFDGPERLPPNQDDVPQPSGVTVRRYYFDIRDNDLFIKDEDGFELPSRDVAKREASISLV